MHLRDPAQRIHRPHHTDERPHTFGERRRGRSSAMYLEDNASMAGFGQHVHADAPRLVANAQRSTPPFGFLKSWFRGRESASIRSRDDVLTITNPQTS